MIPYFEVPPLRVGDLQIQWFGILWLLGWWVGSGVAIARADVEGRRIATTAVLCALAGPIGFLAARFYTMAWSGSGEIAGFAVVALPLAVLWFAVFEPDRMWADLDGAVTGLVPGWIVGRFGSFLVHDDLGVPTLFPLGIRGICPDYLGSPLIACHDLAVYEMAACGLWLWALFALRARGAGAGIATGATAVAWGAWRFLLDGIRPGPYLSSPDQWLEPLMIAAGVLTVLAAGVARETRPPPRS